MSNMNQPTSNLQCVDMLSAVLAYLDSASNAVEERYNRLASLAAIRVEEAIDALMAIDADRA